MQQDDLGVFNFWKTPKKADVDGEHFKAKYAVFIRLYSTLVKRNKRRQPSWVPDDFSIYIWINVDVALEKIN